MTTPVDLVRDHKWSIIPLKANSKQPMFPWYKYQREHMPADRIVQFGRRVTNFAVVTGWISGIVVLDIDHEDLDRFEEFLPDEPTPVAKTPRGWHVYFKHPRGNNLLRELPNHAWRNLGMDFRGDGGYIVLPGSVNHEGQMWEWKLSPDQVNPQPIPDRLLQLLTCGR